MPPEQGEVWRVQLEPVIGSETGKTRPCVVVSRNDVGRLPVRVVVPITDWKPAFAGYAWMTLLTSTPGNGLSKDSAADALQIRTVSLQRFQDKIGSVTQDEQEEIFASIMLCLQV